MTSPGGFDTCEHTLARPTGVEYADTVGLSDVTVVGPGGEIAWQGRLQRAPRASGEQASISPSAQGYRELLRDNKNVSGLYRDRELGRWTGPSSQRRLDLIAANTPHQGDAAQAWNDTAPAITLSIQGAWASPSRPRCEAWYDAGPGERVAKIVGPFSSSVGASFGLFVLVTPDGIVSMFEGTADLYSGAGGTISFTPVARYRRAFIYWDYVSAPAGTDGGVYPINVTPVVYGSHGLTVRGNEPDAGFYDSDIVAHATRRWAPAINVTDESIRPGTFVIGQATFSETTLEDLIGEATRFELPDWQVREGPTLWLTDRGSGRRWRARVGPSRLEETGPAVDRVWTGVVIKYADPDGSTRTVGPPGSGCDVEDALLRDDDPENVANKAGVPRVERFDMGVGVAREAIQVGRQLLAEAKLIDQSGRAQLGAFVLDDRGVLYPSWMVRPDDLLSFVDASDTSYRRIVKADYDEDGMTCSVDLDAPPEGMAALLARLGLVASAIS